MEKDFSKYYNDIKNKSESKPKPKKAKVEKTPPEVNEKTKCSLGFNQKKDSFVLSINLVSEIKLDNPKLNDFKKVRYNLDNISEIIKSLPDL